MTAAVADQIASLHATTPRADPHTRVAKPRRVSSVSAVKVAPPAEYSKLAREVSGALSEIALDEKRRANVAQQIHMLEHELKKRAERLAAMEEAVIEQRVVEARRARRRARLGHRIGLVGSGMLAAMFTGMIVMSVL